MLELRLHPPRAEPGTYLLASRRVVADSRLPSLESFQRGGGELRQLSTARERDPSSALIYRGPGFVGGRERPLECRLGSDGYRVEAGGLGTVTIRPGSPIEISGHAAPGPATGPGGIEDLILGPGLMLGLAMDGVFCFHASAVAFDGRVAVFVGESGAGKSTLAGAPGAPWRRIADDVLPWRLGVSAIEALPRFPQPKLAAADQYGAKDPEGLPIDHLFVLEPAAATEAQEAPRAEPLDGRRSLAAVHRHTVASRLFGPDLLRQHFDHAAEASRSVRVSRLRFSRRLDQLPALVAVVAGALAL